MLKVLPKTDAARAEMCWHVINQAAADQAAGIPYLSQETVDAVTAFLPTFEAAMAARKEAVQTRIGRVAAARVNKKQLDAMIRAVWHETNWRVNHGGQPPELRPYYGLPLNGLFPKISAAAVFTVAQNVIKGDAQAVAAGFAGTVGPTAAELQAAYNAALNADVAKTQAKAQATVCQNKVAALRPQADDLCIQVREELALALRGKPAPEIHAIMMQYGIRFEFDHENDAEMETAVIPEPAAAG